MKIQTKLWNDITWKRLCEYYEEGMRDILLSSGSLISISLKDGQEIELEACRDKKGELFFVFKNCIKYRVRMNDYRSKNEEGYEGSIGRLAAYRAFSLLPDDLQGIIVPTKIVQIHRGKRHEMTDNLFVLSATQVFGEKPWRKLNEPEDTQFDIFQRDTDRIKCIKNDAVRWWLRSSPDGNQFSVVDRHGKGSSDFSTKGNGLVLGFRTIL